jgi:hypothetical protein
MRIVFLQSNQELGSMTKRVLTTAGRSRHHAADRALLKPNV